METPVSVIESLFEKAEAYGKTTFELSKLKAIETTSSVVSSVMSRIIVFITLLVFIVVLSIGVAMLVGEAVGKSYYGFFIVAAFYLVVGVILHFSLQDWLKQSVSKAFISKLFQ